jgi:hypothetical protein
VRLAALLLVVTGCFYTEPLNQRPSVGIAGPDPGTVYRGDTVTLHANKSDPEGAFVRVSWRAYACTDATVGSDGSHPGCDQAPFRTGDQDDFTFQIPTFRAGTTTPEKSILVLLEGLDDLDAAAKPVQQAILDLGDWAPELTIDAGFRIGYVVDVPLDVFAAVSDPDDDIATGAPPPTMTWNVDTPATQPAYDLSDIPNVPQDPSRPQVLQLGKKFTPHGTGVFTFHVIATDQLGMSVQRDLGINIAADHLPCMGTVSPATPPSGDTLPLTEATLFQVTQVTDDLDPYPATSDPYQGVTTFHWSILPPGATTRQPLTTVTGNRVALDPASYVPGDVIELRVEIEDRQNIAPSCADANATCALLPAEPMCLQRVTWKVKVQ